MLKNRLLCYDYLFGIFVENQMPKLISRIEIVPTFTNETRNADDNQINSV